MYRQFMTPRFLSLFSIIFCLLFVIPTKGQSDLFKNPAFNITVFNHSVGIPFKDYFKRPMNIGITLGAEFSYRNNFNSPKQRIELGWYQHANLNTAVWVKSDFIRRFQTEKGFYGEIQGGLGYMLDFSKNESFELQDDGNYKSIGSKRKGGLLIAAGVGTGYQMTVNDKYLITPFVRYEGLIQLPYGKLLPFFPHVLLHLGTRVKLSE